MTSTLQLERARAELPAAQVEQVLFEIKRLIVGQDRLVERLLVALLSRGHVLLEGVPGLAKTATVKSLAQVVGGTFGRIQFTPDLIPADLVGTRLYNGRTGEFSVELGPVFANLLLADEINRAPAKVQSALLEVMQERQVTIGKQSYAVPDPFLVLATQNPIESDGTYPLPEAQLDRFMFKVLVDYPSYEDEIVVVERVTGPAIELRRTLSLEDLRELQKQVDEVYVDPRVTAYAARLVDATRKPAEHGLERLAPALQFGASPRASINLVSGARALAFIRGRTYVLPQDVADLAPDVLRHRLVLSYEGIAVGAAAEPIIGAILQRYAPPKMDLGDPPVSPAEPGDALLRRLTWTLLRPLATRLGGDERSLLRGPGLELAEVREYQPGDDVRHIDWNVTARADQPFVREALVERALDVWLVMDVSESINWGTATCLKRERATEMAAAAAGLLGRRGNRIGAVLFADQPLDVLPPGAGRAHQLRLLARLGETTPRTGETDLNAALARAAAVIRRPSLVIVVSDFLGANGWQHAMRRLSARHEVVGVILRDPREMELTNIGLVAFEDPETGRQLLVDTADNQLRERFREAAAASAARLDKDLTAAGVDHLVVTTDEPLLGPLARFLAARKRRRVRRAA